MSISLVFSLVLLFMTQGNDLNAMGECGFGNIDLNRSFNDPMPRCLEPEQFGPTKPNYTGSILLFTTFIMGFFVTTAIDISFYKSNPRGDKK